MKISVVIPTINHAHWLPESIESALNQTLKPHEVIVVDIAGGSKDNTKEVVARYPVRYLTQPDRGVSDARNHGIRNSSGDWVAFLDSDDYWLPRRLELQVAAITDEAFGYCATTRFYQDGHTEDMEYYNVPEALSVLRHHNFIDTSAALVRRDAMERIGGFNLESCAGEEWEAWLKLSRYYKFVGVPDRLLMYRVTGTGLSVNPVTVLNSVEFIVSAATSHLPAVERFVVANRMRSVRTALAAIKYRDMGEYSQCLHHAVRAFAHWPSPFYDKAFKVILLELKRRLTGKNNVQTRGSDV